MAKRPGCSHSGWSISTGRITDQLHPLYRQPLRIAYTNSILGSMESYPYETRLNIAYEPLQVIDEKSLADACEYQWYNQTLCQVNGSVVRLGVVQGEYHWHHHENDDEFF